jgi:hypothetical protein
MKTFSVGKLPGEAARRVLESTLRNVTSFMVDEYGGAFHELGRACPGTGKQFHS